MAAAVAMAALWLGLLRGGANHRTVLHAPRLNTAIQGRTNDNYDWAAGVPQGRQLVQFVPGGRFTFSA